MTRRTSLAGALAACLVMLFAFTGSAAAQSGKLTGIVTDQQTGEPLAGVQVYLEGTGRGTLTQENGRYFLINVEPGEYTVVAEIIGYATVRKPGIQVSIDLTRTIDFVLPQEAVAVDLIVVEAERIPLVPRGQTGSIDIISAREIDALPVTDIMGVLALEQGFQQVSADNTDVVSYAQQRQGVTSLRIRGGRTAETMVLIDGIAINNFVLGGPAFDITNEAIEQVAFLKGHFDAQYGNALSGVINYATREGGTELEGEMNYRTSAMGDWLGNGYDQVRDWDMFEGFVSGPVPGTEDRLRFMLAGRQRMGAWDAFEFDDDIFLPSAPGSGVNLPDPLDVIPGWRAFGFDQQRDIYGKLTFFATPNAKLNVSWMGYTREAEPFDFDWMLDVDPLPLQRTRQDSLYYLARTRFLRQQLLVQNSLNLQRDLLIGRWDHTVGRTAYRITAGVLNQERETCSVFGGVCLGTHFEDRNFTLEGFIQALDESRFTPTGGTDIFFGGEDLQTFTGRLDVQSQVSDHHNLSGGLFFQRHDLKYDEWEDKGVNEPFPVHQFYEATPWDGALYLEDRIEYDFITIKLGARFDYGKATGQFFANPVDPTNGTTALQVCQNPAQWQNRQILVPIRDDAGKVIGTERVTRSADLGWTTDICFANQAIRTEAALIASADDFEEAEARTQFSPRIGVSIPVTESSQLFFNFGRYSQNPILRNTYQNTGIGTIAEGTVAGPLLASEQFVVPFLGNPHLNTEIATMYEIGYSQEIGGTYALSALLYTKDQTGLTGLAPVGSAIFPVQDPGVTYGSSSPQYTVLINKDFATTRGAEVSFRRRLQDYWGFDLSYGYMQCRTNAAEPEREFEEQQEHTFDPTQLREVPCEIDQPHNFTGVLTLGVDEDYPDLPFGRALRNSAISFVARAWSGLPYTPTRSLTGFGQINRGDRYSRRMPGSFRLDLKLQKDFQVSNVAYGAFINVINLTDRRNCQLVFATTGNCLSGAEDQQRRQQGNPEDDINNISSTFFDRPFYFDDRREIEAGLRIRF